MTIGERIKKIRKKEKLTQSEFASRIGLSQNTIANYELDRRIPSEQVNISICREFNVNHNWLVDGIGEPFLPEPSGLIYELKVQYNLSDTEVEILTNYLKLSNSQREGFIKFVEQIFNKNKADTNY